VKLVDDDIRIGIKALRTDLGLKKAEKEKLLAEKYVFEAELQSELATQKEVIKVRNLEYASVKDRLTLAEKNLDRVDFLYRKELISEDKFMSEKDKVLILRGETELKKARINVARQEYQQLKTTNKKVDVILEKVKIIELEQGRITDNIRLEEVELTYRRILSPINGIIGRIHRFKGEYIEDGNTILSLHNPNIYWIEAYVDESQIRHVARDKRVLIDFESYPFEDFYGKVEYVGNLTTAQTGVKTNSSRSSFSSGVERVPVKVSISNPPPDLTPGMRASVNIRIYENIKLW
jgi:membrane fusion protein (multidrug efflux system)